MIGPIHTHTCKRCGTRQECRGRRRHDPDTGEWECIVYTPDNPLICDECDEIAVEEANATEADQQAAARQPPRARYCEMCDQWLGAKHTECPACGAATVKAAEGRKTEITRAMLDDMEGF